MPENYINPADGGFQSNYHSRKLVLGSRSSVQSGAYEAVN
jgi:hypothetical protein